MLRSVYVLRHIYFIVTLFLFGFTPHTLFGQATTYATFTGFVFDAATGEPLPGANIYLSQSLLGSATDDLGAYAIKGIPMGSYEVVASMIGYIPVRITAQFDAAAPFEHTFTLEPDIVHLSGIEVVDKRPRNWKRNVRRFKKLFLGSTTNSDDCTLTNPEYLNIEQADRNRFVVSTNQPLIIENKALGYRISYMLDSFVADQHTTSFKGPMHFEEMTPDSEQEAWQWEANRRATYNGSLVHFLSALDKGHLIEEGFMVSTTYEPGHLEKASIEDLDELVGRGTSPTRKHINILRYLEITYTRAEEDMAYVLEAGRQFPKNQTSWLTVLDSPAEFYSNGTLANPYSLKNYGYWAWLRVCDMLPVEYGLSD